MATRRKQLERIVSQVITPQVSTIPTDWDAKAIRSALIQHMNGEFSETGRLFDSMLEDDEFPGTLQKRLQATLRSEFQLSLPVEERDLTAQEQEIEALFPRMAPDPELFDLMASWLVLGVGIATVDWEKTADRWIPTIRTLPTEFLRHDRDARKWYYQIDVFKSEGVEGFNEVEVTPGDGKWILMASGQRPWRWGLIRGLAELWFSKQQVLGDWQRFCQKHGLPIFKAIVPLHGDANEKEDFVDDLDSMQSEGIVALPRDENGVGYDIELLEARDTAWKSFQNNLERADRKFQVMLLGGNLGAEVTSQGANRAAAETHAKSVDRDKAKSDAKLLGSVLQDQLLRPFVELNFTDRAIIPFPFWDTCPEDSIRQWVEAQSVFIHMLGQMPAAGYELMNAEAIGRDYGFKLRQLTDEEKEKAATRGETSDGGGGAHPKAEGQE